MVQLGAHGRLGLRYVGWRGDRRLGAASTGWRWAQTAAWPAWGPRVHGGVDAVDGWLAAERDQWPLWIPVAFGAGIALWFGLPWALQRETAVALLLAMACAGAAISRVSTRLLAAAALLAAGGLACAAYRSADIAAPVLRGERLAEFDAIVESVEDVQARNRWRIVVTPADHSLPPSVRVGVRGQTDPAVLPGAKLHLRAMLSAPGGPPLPGGYDFARREYFEGVGAVGYALGPPKVIATAPPPSAPVAWLETARVDLTRWLERGVRGQGGAVSAAFVTGDEGAITPETMTDFRASGLAHLLSISGLHIAAVIGATMWGTRRLLSLWPWLALRVSTRNVGALAAALAAIAYTVLAGSQIPAVRSCLAALIVLLGLLLGREAVSLRLVAGGALFILVARPEALLNPSFQMSFAAITGLVALYSVPAMRRFARTRPGEGVWKRMARHWSALLLAGLVAETILAPASLYHFQQAGLYGMFANLIAIPLTELVIMPMLALSLALGAVGLAQPAFWGVRVTMGWLLWLARWVGGWPGAQLHMAAMSDTAFAFIVGGTLWLCLWRARARLLGVVPIVVGAALAFATPVADVLVSADGKHLALRDDRGALRMLRDRGGDYEIEMWGKAVAANGITEFAGVNSACSDEACVARIHRGGGSWRVLATRSKEIVDRDRFEPACAAADVVVSDRRLPRWCKPRWLRLDAPTLARTGALSIRFGDTPEVRTVEDRTGDHPWHPEPKPRRPRGQYRRSNPANRPWTRTREGK